MNGHYVYLFRATWRCRAFLAECYLSASVWCLLKSCCSDCGTPHLVTLLGKQQGVELCSSGAHSPSEELLLMGSQHEQSSCWQSSFKCQYSGHLGMNVSVCIMQCVHYAPLSCKPVGTKSCVTGFQASTRAVNENLVSFYSWVLVGCTGEIETLSIAMPTCLLLMPSSKGHCWLAAVMVLLNTERNLRKCFLCWHTD